MRFCGNCGAQVPPGAPFCGRCGASQAPLQVATMPAYAYPSAPGRPRTGSGRISSSQVMVAAGLLILVSGETLFDPLIALGLAAAIALGTVRELARGGEQLLWPPTLVCGHGEDEA